MFETIRVWTETLKNWLEPQHVYVFDIKVYEPMYEREFPITLPDRVLVYRATKIDNGHVVDECALKMGYHQIKVTLTEAQKEEFLEFCSGKSAYRVIGHHDLGKVVRDLQ